jgi:CubicO group peptidase (beta-lactamase class C family)
MSATNGSGFPPPALDDGWPVASPAERSLDESVLGGLAKQFEAWTDANLHAALIVRDGTLVYERYFAGEDEAFGKPLGRVAYDATMRHDLRSITKSVTSLVFGIAVDRGWVPGVDAKVLPFFPEHADLRTPEKDAIAIEHLLTMSAGFAWNEAIPYSNPKNSERRMIDAPDAARYVLEQPIVRPPGVAYNYNGGQTLLLAEILKRATGKTLDALAQEVLFAPLGITEVEWVRYADGEPMAPSGLRMRPRDVAKVGAMVAGGGLWQGRRIVSADWISRSLTPQINGESLFFYGYQWWLGRSLIERKEITWGAAFGYGGQRLFVLPQYKLAVVVMAGLYAEPVLQSVAGEVVLRRYALGALRDR